MPPLKFFLWVTGKFWGWSKDESSHLPWGPGFLQQSTIYHKMPACHAHQVSPVSGSVDTQHLVARSMAPSVFFWTAFYMFFNIKSWQLHLILFMEMLSHVFLLKSLWVEKPCVLPMFFFCLFFFNVFDIQTVLQWVCCHRNCLYLQPLQISWTLLSCHTNHSVCLKPVAVKTNT